MIIKHTHWISIYTLFSDVIIAMMHFTMLVLAAVINYYNIRGFLSYFNENPCTETMINRKPYCL